MKKIRIGDLVTVTTIDPYLPKDQVIEFPDDGIRVIVNGGKIQSVKDSINRELVDDYLIYSLDVEPYDK